MKEDLPIVCPYHVANRSTRGSARVCFQVGEPTCPQGTLVRCQCGAGSGFQASAKPFFLWEKKGGIGRRVEREPAREEIGGQCSREEDEGERREWMRKTGSEQNQSLRVVGDAGFE